MKINGIVTIHCYKIPRGAYGRPSIITPNKLQRDFTVKHPNRAWVTDITYIRTWQGWLYLAVVMDLFTRKVVGWSMKPSGQRVGARCHPDGRVATQAEAEGTDSF